MDERDELQALRRLAELEAKAASSQPAAPSFGEMLKNEVANSLPGRAVRAIPDLAAGAVRGAGSIGSTILSGKDFLEQKLADAMGATEKGYVAGNPNRREEMTQALGMLGADTDSTAFAAGKLGGEIAGTAGAGGALGNAIARIPGAATAMPGVINALRTGGMSTGRAVAPGAMAAVRDISTRALGGAVAGGASAGLVDPSQTGTGAAVGGALPVVAKLAGSAGNAAGKLLRGPEQAPDLAKAIQEAQKAGYVIPPTQAKPTLGNRLMEGMAGKLSTAQNASARNQAVTNRLSAEALGLPSDTKITADVLKVVRDKAGSAYDAIGNAGTVMPKKSYADALDAIAAPHLKAAQGFPNAKPSPVIDLVNQLRAPSFDASSAVAKIKELRSAADDAFRGGNTDIARASKSAAAALEDALETHLGAAGQANLLAEFRDARKLIAKTYSVEKALNQTTGSVDARKLAAQLARGKPLSGELRSAADFAARFPKASQAVEGMGSLPQTSPLDWAMGGTAAALTSNPLALAGVMARPMARSMALSGPVQRGLVQPAANQAALAELFASPEAQSLLYRSAPVALTGR